MIELLIGYKSQCWKKNTIQSIASTPAIVLNVSPQKTINSSRTIDAYMRQ